MDRTTFLKTAGAGAVAVGTALAGCSKQEEDIVSSVRNKLTTPQGVLMLWDVVKKKGFEK